MAGDSEATIARLQADCRLRPREPEPLVRLARAFLAAHRAAEAVAPAEQAVALAPRFSAARKARDAVLAAIAATEPGLAALELHAAVHASDPESQLDLGQAYADLNRPHDAERCFKAALALGRTQDAHAVLAALYLSMSMWDAAEHHATAALDALGGDDLLAAMARQVLAGVCEGRGDLAGAARQRDLACAARSLFHQPAPGAAFTTLVLLTTGAGNIACHTLMPARSFDRHVWYMEHARTSQFADLPPHQVVLNAIGDPDFALASQAIVEAFVAQSGRPVLNPPARVRATVRHHLPATLAGLADVTTPRTARLTAAAIAQKGLPAAVAEAGLSPPVLIRPTASHGGQGLVLARDAAELASLVPPEGDAYASAYCDYASPDGYFRKYRVIFIDRRPFPYHLAISRQWMVHHDTSAMTGDGTRQAEEMAFLEDPRAALGGKAMAAIEAIGRRLDLDYGGADFTLTPDGGVLVFEANATMLTHLEADDSEFAAKNAHIRPIIEAFQAHLAAVAGV